MQQPKRKGRQTYKRSAVLSGKVLLFCFFELILAYAAKRAGPVIGQIFKGGAGGDAVVGIADFGIVLITAGAAYVLIHCCAPFLVFCISLRTEGNKPFCLFSRKRQSAPYNLYQPHRIARAGTTCFLRETTPFKKI